MSICVIASAGGHLAEARRAVTALPPDALFYVTFELPHIKESMLGREIYYVIDPHTSLWKYAVNFFQSLWIFVRKRPKIVLTTGAGIAVPMCIIAKCFGRKLIFVESGARISSASRTGKLLHKIADLTLVQWEPMLEHYPNAVYGGFLI